MSTTEAGKKVFSISFNSPLMFTLQGEGFWKEATPNSFLRLPPGDEWDKKKIKLGAIFTAITGLAEQFHEKGKLGNRTVIKCLSFSTNVRMLQSKFFCPFEDDILVYADGQFVAKEKSAVNKRLKKVVQKSSTAARTRFFRILDLLKNALNGVKNFYEKTYETEELEKDRPSISSLVPTFAKKLTEWAGERHQAANTIKKVLGIFLLFQEEWFGIEKLLGERFYPVALEKVEDLTLSLKRKKESIGVSVQNLRKRLSPITTLEADVNKFHDLFGFLGRLGRRDWEWKAQGINPKSLQPGEGIKFSVKIPDLLLTPQEMNTFMRSDKKRIFKVFNDKCALNIYLKRVQEKKQFALDIKKGNSRTVRNPLWPVGPGYLTGNTLKDFEDLYKVYFQLVDFLDQAVDEETEINLLLNGVIEVLEKLKAPCPITINTKSELNIYLRELYQEVELHFRALEKEWKKTEGIRKKWNQDPARKKLVELCQDDWGMGCREIDNLSANDFRRLNREINDLQNSLKIQKEKDGQLSLMVKQAQQPEVSVYSETGSDSEVYEFPNLKNPNAAPMRVAKILRPLFHKAYAIFVKKTNKKFREVQTDLPSCEILISSWKQFVKDYSSDLPKDLIEEGADPQSEKQLQLEVFNREWGL